MKKVYRVWSEWDIGLADTVFTSEFAAERAIEINYSIKELLSTGEFGTIDEMFAEGLLKIEEINIES